MSDIDCRLSQLFLGRIYTSREQRTDSWDSRFSTCNVEDNVTDWDVAIDETQMLKPNNRFFFIKLHWLILRLNENYYFGYFHTRDNITQAFWRDFCKWVVDRVRQCIPCVHSHIYTLYSRRPLSMTRPTWRGHQLYCDTRPCTPDSIRTTVTLSHRIPILDTRSFCMLYSPCHSDILCTDSISTLNCVCRTPRLSYTCNLMNLNVLSKLSRY